MSSDGLENQNSKEKDQDGSFWTSLYSGLSFLSERIFAYLRDKFANFTKKIEDIPEVNDLNLKPKFDADIVSNDDTKMENSPILGQVSLENFAGRLKILEMELRKNNLPEQEIQRNLDYAKTIFNNMVVHSGQSYEGKVGIKSVDGSSWEVKNSCTGNIMKIFEKTPVRLFGAENNFRKGSRFATNFRWNAGDDEYLNHLVRDKKDVVYMNVPYPHQVDELIGKYLLTGECAPFRFWNHVGWIYKDTDGKIWFQHSGRDIRPKKIVIKDKNSVPSGYNLDPDGKTATKIEGAKVNNIPLSDFIAALPMKIGPKAKVGDGKVGFIPLRRIVASNLDNLS